MRPLAARVVLTFAALDVTFKALVSLAFLMVMGGSDPARREQVLDLLVRIAGPWWCIWLGLVWFLSRPIDELAASLNAGRADDALLQRGGGASARLPLRLALL